MLTGCPGVKIEDVKQVALGSDTGAGDARRASLHYAVLHLDDLAGDRDARQEVHILLAMKNTNPTSHYLMLVARKDNLAENRDAFVRARRRTDRGRAFHAGPQERRRGRGRRIGATGHTKAEVTKQALKEFLAIDFWATKDDGLTAQQARSRSPS